MSPPRIYDPTRGAARELVDPDELRRGVGNGWIRLDPRRLRTLYFDGRFLAARDLTRDQQYFLTRQADLGQLGGGGVVTGLDVSVDEPGQTITITAGHGVTPAGESVVLRSAVNVDIGDLPAMQRLEATFGLDRRPAPPIRNRTGVFALALRPVEYSANPIASYPTSLTGERQLHDGDIVEAVAVTLVPFEAATTAAGLRGARAGLARRIFLENRSEAAAAEALPIAVVALERGRILWVDSYLVRRDAGADTALGFGLGHRSVREAFVRQYARQLADVVDDLGDVQRPFAAAEHFESLPPVGPLPANAVEVRGGELVQWFFPPAMNIELSVVPADEVSALIEDGLTLAPIDLQTDAAALEAVPLLIAVPVPRAEFAVLVSQLSGSLSRAPRERARGLTRLKPIDGLIAINMRRARADDAEEIPIDLAPWQRALSLATGAGGAGLHYVRRRQFSQEAFVVPRYRTLPPGSPLPSSTLAAAVRLRLNDAGELERFDLLVIPTDPDNPDDPDDRNVLDELETLLDHDRFGVVQMQNGQPALTTPRRIMVAGVMAELSSRARSRISSETTGAGLVAAGAGLSAPLGNSAGTRVRALQVGDVDVVKARYTADAALGTGITALVTAVPALGTDAAVARVIGQSRRVVELDAKARASSAGVAAMAAELLTLAQRADLAGIRRLAGPGIPSTPPGGTDPGPEPDPGPETPAALRARDIYGAGSDGEHKLFWLIYDTCDTVYRAQLEDVLMRAGFDQPFMLVAFLMELLTVGWGFTPSRPQDVADTLEALQQWRPEQTTPFHIPNLTQERPDPRLHEALGLTVPNTYRTAAGVGQFAAATTRLVAGGLVASPKTWRVLGLSMLATEIITTMASRNDQAVGRFAGRVNTAVAADNVAAIGTAYNQLVVGL
jgi:hypothetical protein